GPGSPARLSNLITLPGRKEGHRMARKRSVPLPAGDSNQNHRHVVNDATSNPPLTRPGVAETEEDREAPSPVGPPDVPLPDAPPILLIAREAPDEIHVGAGGKLVVPREELDQGVDDDAEMDLVTGLAKKIRKPG